MINTTEKVMHIEDEVDEGWSLFQQISLVRLFVEVCDTLVAVEDEPWGSRPAAVKHAAWLRRIKKDLSVMLDAVHPILGWACKHSFKEGDTGSTRKASLPAEFLRRMKKRK